MEAGKSKSGERKKKDAGQVSLIAVALIALICTAIPVIVDQLRQNEYECFLRNWVNALFYIGMICWQIAAVKGSLYLDRWKIASVGEAVLRIIERVFLTIACIIAILIVVFAALVHDSNHGKSIRNANGTYTYIDQPFLSDPEYYLCEGSGPFYLHYLRRMTGPEDDDPDVTNEDWAAARNAEYQQPTGNGKATGQASSVTGEEKPVAAESDMDDNEGNAGTDGFPGEDSIYYEEDDVHDGYIRIYEECFKAEGDIFDEEYNARGNSYVILKEDGAYINYLMYDRDSANGKCGLYVLYRSRTNNSTGAVILDMYACEYGTGKVVSSGKKAWADTGSDEYRKLTGE